MIDTDTLTVADSVDPARSASIGRTIREWIVVIAIALGVALMIRGFAIAPFSIPSGSMHQTLVEDDRILVNKLSYRLHDVRRGDVVVFEKPPNVDFGPKVKDLVKRVIGVPGDVVEIHDCQVFVNGQQLDEPYRNGDCTEKGNESSDPDGDGRNVVPERSYLVMGDNRVSGQSWDGRFWGFVDEDLIVGRAFVVVFPFGHWRWL